VECEREKQNVEVTGVLVLFREPSLYYFDALNIAHDSRSRCWGVTRPFAEWRGKGGLALANENGIRRGAFLEFQFGVPALRVEE
jgi:hypothetical protein